MGAKVSAHKWSGYRITSVLHDIKYASIAASVLPYPATIRVNPDHLPTPRTITLFDATGRLVLQQLTTDTRPVIATEALPAGLYRIAVRDEKSGAMVATRLNV